MESNRQWAELEDRRAEWMDALFRHLVGLAVDSAEIEELASAVASQAEAIAPACHDDPAARSLLGNLVREARLNPIELEVQQLADRHYTFEDFQVDGKPVAPYSRPRYLSQEADPRKRSEILSRVMAGHPDVDRAWARHHALQTELAAEWGATPLDDLLASEGLDLARLRALLVDLATAMRPTFERCFAANRATVLGDRQGEDWEDFITLFMNCWSADVNQRMPNLDGLTAVRRVARKMGFAIDAIAIDLEDRRRKMPGAFAADVRPPSDVRITVKPVGGAADLTSLYHEMGHALHYLSIDPELPCPERLAIPPSVAETFSFWLQSLLAEPAYLRELGFDEAAAVGMIGLEQLGQAAATTWGPAQALCLLDFWTDGPYTLLELGGLLSGYMQRFMGISAPAESIRVLPTFVRPLHLHVVGYPIAYTRTGHLLSALEATERHWWRSAGAVDLVRDHMRGGRTACFSASMLDIDPFVARTASLDPGRR